MNNINIFTRLNKVVEACKVPDGGATIDTQGNNANAPYYASPFPEFETVLDSADKLTPQNIHAYINAHSETLSDKQNYVGLWNDPDTGKIYLDISRGYNDKEKVKKDCKKYSQLAYFDALHGVSVPVN